MINLWQYYKILFKKMLTIYKISKEKIEDILHIANNAWKATYTPILSAAQIDWMYAQSYTEEAIKAQMQKGDTFLVAYFEGKPVGFVSYNIHEDNCSIPKLYILPNNKGAGIGKALLNAVLAAAVEAKCTAIQLNVNRYNVAAINFYFHMGFNIKAWIDIPYGAYVLNDYEMEKNCLS